MWLLVGTLIMIALLIILIGNIAYKDRVIEDLEKRTPRIYQEFVDVLNKLKTYQDLEDEKEKEMYTRGLINDSIEKYARRYRNDLDELIWKASQDYFKKN